MRASIITPTIRGIEGLYRPAFGLMNQTFKDFEWLYEIHNPQDPPDLNACLNRLIKRSKGDIIIFLQDYILPSPRGIQQFLEAIEFEEAFYTAPVGKIQADETIEYDWRRHRKTDETLNFMEWEIDWAAAPRYALEKVGGFDEELDKYWGFDNVNIGSRVEAAGFKIKCLPENTAIAVDHNKIIEHPYQKLRNPDFHNMRLGQIMRGEVEVKYL